MRSAVVLAALMLLVPSPALARQAEENVVGSRIELVPADGTRLEFEGRHYRGRFAVTGHSAGLAVTEEVSLDQYLYGIVEVPFSWPIEALRAQAVAARTYLAWTLDQGQSSTGLRYGYDICATTACQVYAGVDAVETTIGARWRDAVEDTSGEILLHQDRPAQALYSSTSGGFTRSVQDIFPGANAKPYLVGVLSPGEDSPFVEWTFELTSAEMSRLLDEAGLLEGVLVDVTTETRPDGAGSWIVEIEGTRGTTRIGTWELRSELNAAAWVLPDKLPALRPDGKRYPQTILSPTFTIHPETRFIPPQGGPPRFERVYVFEGNGWGHSVGMSQYGAEAMASAGAGYAEILRHYYGGLDPQGWSNLPERVTVGLAVERDEVELGADGPVTVSIDGEVVASEVLGTWRFEAAGDEVRVVPPVGLGLPPEIRDAHPIITPWGQPVALQASLATSSEVRVLVGLGGRWVPATRWEVHDAGTVTWPWTRLRVPPMDRVAVRVEARSPEGEARVDLTVVLVRE